MGINFTDQQVKDLSLTTLQLPLIIDNPAEGTGLIQQQEKVQIQKDSLFDLDQEAKIFTDFWITVLASYGAELERLNKVAKTPYVEADIQAGGQSKPPHYEGSWPNLVPIVIPSSTGLPESVSGVPDETDRIADLDDPLDKTVNGFGGAFDTTLDFAYTIGSGVIQLVAGTPTPGDLIIIDSGGNSTLFLVGAEGGFCTPTATPDTEPQCATEGGVWTVTIGVTPISTDKNFSAGARVRNFHIGFTNAERGHQGAPNYAFDVMEYFEGLIDQFTNDWEANLNDQLTAVTGNEDNIPDNIIANEQAETDINVVLADIATWEALPIIDANGRFTDSKLPLLTDNTTLRTTQLANRITEVGTSLGPLTQAPDGVVTGVGAYASLYEFVSIRISKSGGFLYGFFSIGLGIIHFDIKIDNANNQLAQYNNSFAISKIVADTVVSQIDFEVESVAEFSIGQTVKVMDNDSVVFTRVIDNIIATTLTLDSGIPAILTLGSIARVVRVK